MSVAVHSVEPSPTRGIQRSYVLPFLAFSLAALLFYLLLFFAGPHSHKAGELLGPDSYMQIVRLREFIDAGDWYYNAVARANAPYGDISHWTKPYELVLLLTTSAFRPFMDLDASTLWAGIVISPMLHIVLSLVLAWASAPAIGRARFWVVPIVLLNFPVIQQAMPGSADHHVFLVTIFAIAVGFALRMLVERHNRFHATAAGVGQGFALWCSVEFILLTILTIAFATLWWILTLAPTTRRQVSRQFSAFSASLIFTIFVALLAEYRLENVTTPAPDRISVIYFGFSIFAGGAWVALGSTNSLRCCRTRAGRSVTAAAIGIFAAVGMTLVFPDFFKGPYADVSPTVNDFFLRHVREVRSLFDLTVPSAIAYYSDAIVGILILSWTVAANRVVRLRPAWLFLFACAALYTILALCQLRFVTTASILSAIPVAWLLHLLRRYSRAHLRHGTGVAFRIFVTVLLVLGPGFLAASIPQAARLKPYVCPIDKIRPMLNAMPGEHIIFTPNLFAGPAILFHTRHSVIGTPYHRNKSGIEDTLTIMAATEDGIVREIITKRRIDMILICKKKKSLWDLSPAVAQSDSFYTRVMRGNPPRWLRPIYLSPPINEIFDLYTVVPGS